MMQSLENHEGRKCAAQLEIQEGSHSSFKNAQELYSFLRDQYELLSEDYTGRHWRRYEGMMAEAATLERNRQEELDQLRLQVARLEEEKAKDAVHHRLQLQELRQSMNSEVQKNSQESERLKRVFQQRIQNLDEHWTKQTQEMKTAFDWSLRKQEHAYKLKMDQLLCVRLSQDRKIKQLTEQVECYSQAQLQDKEAVKASEEACQQTQTQLEQKQREMEALTAVKDQRILALEQKVEERMRKLQKEKDDHDRKFKKQLSVSLEREKTLEQKLVHVELEWQKRCEDIKAQNYVDFEQLIEQLTQDRAQAKAELCEKEQELQDVTVLLHSVQKERDQAKQAQNQASEETRHLQEQIDMLHTVIQTMKKDMEDVTHHQVSLQHRCPEAADAVTVSAGALTSDLKKQEVGPTHLESVPTSVMDQAQNQASEETCHLQEQINMLHTVIQTMKKDMEDVTHPQSVLVPQLQPENLHQQQRQQQALAQAAAHSHGCTTDKSCNLYPRLKNAVLCVARLNQEKQQLIEIGNRLRCQIHTDQMAPVEDCSQLNLSNLSLPSSDCSKVPQTSLCPLDKTKPELNSSTGKQEDQHERLDVLENLQYQLTTQELQYVMRQKLCRFGEVPPGPTSQSPVPKEAEAVWFQSHQDTEEPVSHRKSTKLLHMGSSTAPSSSGESPRSLTQLWKSLDHGLSPSIFSEGEGALSRSTGAGCGGHGVQMEVNGISAPVHTHPPAQIQQKVNTSTGPSATTKRRSVPKIRNYNIKD